MLEGLLTELKAAPVISSTRLQEPKATLQSILKGSAKKGVKDGISNEIRDTITSIDYVEGAMKAMSAIKNFFLGGPPQT